MRWTTNDRSRYRTGPAPWTRSESQRSGRWRWHAHRSGGLPIWALSPEVTFPAAWEPAEVVPASEQEVGPTAGGDSIVWLARLAGDLPPEGCPDPRLN